MAVSNANEPSRATADTRDLLKKPKIRAEAQGRTLAPAKYLPLLPKPPPRAPLKALKRRSKASKKPGQQTTSQQGCRVKLCPLVNCHLRSHREYIPPRSIKLSSSIESASSDADVKQLPSEIVLRHCLRQAASPPLRSGGVDGLPALPLDGVDNSVIRELFHHFFDYHQNHILRLNLPPPISKAEKQAQERYRRKNIAMAVSAPVYCLHFITFAHQQMAFARDSRCLDRNTNLLYGKIMTLLRHKLDNFHSNEASNLVLVIFTLSVFDIAAGQIKNLWHHRNAVKHLINTSGGVHNMEQATATVLSLDRLISMFTCDPPIFSPPVAAFIRQKPTFPLSYGAYFSDISTRSLHGEGIRQYCDDACRAIEILEGDGLTFGPLDPPMPITPNVHYFFFLRDCVVNAYVRLNVEMANEQSISRCVLLTAKMVEYAALMDNYLAPVPRELAKKVQNIMGMVEKDQEWKDHQSLLLWILFVLVSLSVEWDGRSWALTILKDQLELKYHGEQWPKDWRQRELDSLRRFVWSDLRFCAKFAKACNDLQSLDTTTSEDDSTRLVEYRHIDGLDHMSE